jgi:hypothetical protein
MKKKLKLFGILFSVLGVTIVSCSIMYEDIIDHDLFLYSIVLICMAFIARKQIKKK